LRGYSRDAGLSGKNFARASLAWHFPIANIYNGLYIPPFGLGKLHGNLFTETGDAWNDKEDRNLLQSIGVELSTELLIGYDTLAFPISFGFAHGLDDEKGDNTAYIRLEIGLL
jgi:outer membrane protein assembly factor BamA